MYLKGIANVRLLSIFLWKIAFSKKIQLLLILTSYWIGICEQPSFYKNVRYNLFIQQGLIASVSAAHTDRQWVLNTHMLTAHSPSLCLIFFFPSLSIHIHNSENNHKNISITACSFQIQTLFPPNSKSHSRWDKSAHTPALEEEEKKKILSPSVLI